MATPKRPLFITIISYLLLIEAIIILLGIAGMYIALKSAPTTEQMALLAVIGCSAIVDLIIAYGMSSMRRWAGYAYVLTVIAHWVMCYFASPAVYAGNVPQSIIIVIQVIVCAGVLLHHHEMEASDTNGYITAFGGLIFFSSVMPVILMSFLGHGLPSTDDGHVRQLADVIVKDGIESDGAQLMVTETFYTSTPSEPSALAEKLQSRFNELGHKEFGVTMPPGEHRVLIRNNDSGNAISVTIDK